MKKENIQRVLMVFLGILFGQLTLGQQQLINHQYIWWGIMTGIALLGLIICLIIRSIVIKHSESPSGKGDGL